MSRRISSAAVAVLLAASGAAHGQEWPARSAVKVVVPFTAGSSTDICARVVFEQVGKQVGQNFVIENRGGGGTTIGAQAVAKAEPDGYTLLVNSTSQVAVAATYAKLGYDPREDFAGISSIADLPLLIIAPVKYKTMADLVAAGRAGSLNYGSAGIGSAGHLFLERFRLSAGMNATHVPFRGTPEGVTEIIAGRLDFFPPSVLSAVEFARDGKLTAAAVGSAKRARSMPEVPTTEEAGIKNAGYEFWVGAFAPAKTPRPIVERLAREVHAALKLPEVATKIENVGGEPMAMSPAEFDAFVRKEIQVNVDIVAASGFKPQ